MPASALGQFFLLVFIGIKLGHSLLEDEMSFLVFLALILEVVMGLFVLILARFRMKLFIKCFCSRATSNIVNFRV
jgi:hypothetical protein